jgi:hypothetical protein
MKELLLPAAAALLAAAVPAVAAAPAQPAPAREEVRIPLASFTIRGFHPDGDEVVYLEGPRRQWYRAELAPRCYELQSAIRIALDTRFNGSTLDNSSSLIVGREHCRITSLTRADGPPPRRRRH